MIIVLNEEKKAIEGEELEQQCNVTSTGVEVIKNTNPEYRMITDEDYNSEVILAVKTADIVGANELHVEAGTNGYHGGDGGHGGVSFFSIENASGTGFSFHKIRENQFGIDDEGFYVEFFGDSELDTLIEALDFISSTLKIQRDEIGRTNMH